ncbi:MAG: hypothetical protein HY876_09705 [Coriobacteriales bacterium]|nr:hypothetical protein [Coriobacteriales bacterium]
MSEHTPTDEQVARQAIRDAFPMDAGLSADKTWRMHSELRPVAVESAQRRRAGFSTAMAIAATLAVAAGVLSVFVITQNRLPEPSIAERPDSTPTVNRPNAAPTQSSRAIPALALHALNPSGEVLHFTSVAKTEFGPEAGESVEEMWSDPETGAGRLVRTVGRGKNAVTTLVISDGSAASITTRIPGQPSRTQPADLSGRLGKSFDRLSAYRRMLESGVATVTARGTRDGVKTYKLRAQVDGFADGQLQMVMEAEVRADDYLPIGYRSGFVDSSGKTLPLRTRTFSEFEHVDVDKLPKDWFTPAAGSGEGDGEASELLDL